MASENSIRWCKRRINEVKMKDNRLTIFQQVRDLETWQSVAFSAALLERMLPNYQLFCEATEFADPSPYRNSLSKRA